MCYTDFLLIHYHIVVWNVTLPPPHCKNQVGCCLKFTENANVVNGGSVDIPPDPLLL